jgi:uncharacterized protein (DUF1684 family)
MSVSLVQWRREIASLYARVREACDIRAAHDDWRATRDALFATHPDSPLTGNARSSFNGLDIAPYNPRLHFEVALDTDVAPKRLQISTGTDGEVVFDRIGLVHIEAIGSLDVWWLASYSGGLFVPVRDGLAGSRTYGGGRYVIDTAKGADLGGDEHSLVIDFNFAYNPSCAYDVRWACPLAPEGNVVSVPLLAGELIRS